MIDYTKESKLSVKIAVEKLTKDLMDNKWGVLSVIDVKKILAEKLKVEFDDYVILDVCNPVLAHRGLTINKQAGLILPCKIVVYSDNGKTKVSLYRPTIALSTASSLKGYDKLNILANEAEDALKKIIDMQQG
ncbi:MAG: DUF302 domain-containing protein [Candidatus Methanoperedens sp.]|nr:DUF302 domain-containing protein [Candidatus Methanoperedens sp.]